MLRYKRLTTATLTDGAETIAEILSGVKGKNYRIVSISTAPLADMYLRVYRNAEQIVDAASIIMTTAKPVLLMDLPIEIGATVRVGFYNNGAVTTAKQITIGYEDK
ncbi:hypothetical protein LCGC14_1106460 [marine sediment metagenome]|uniref:Uncharacterized protein n=1 Tax=marine sediment metagenome TaxID=412755 RepID=A0A0F9MCP2_9ZZZZ